MFVSMDFEVLDDTVTAEEAITAVRSYFTKYDPAPDQEVTVHRGPNSIKVNVRMTLVRASHSPLPLENIPS